MAPPVPGRDKGQENNGISDPVFQDWEAESYNTATCKNASVVIAAIKMIILYTQ